MAPSFLEKFGKEMVKIHVRNEDSYVWEEKVYNIHKKLICNASPYFAEVLSTTDSTTLQVHPRSFDTFGIWLYRQDQSILFEITDPECFDVDECVELYILANLISCTELKSLVIHHLHLYLKYNVDSLLCYLRECLDKYQFKISELLTELCDDIFQEDVFNEALSTLVDLCIAAHCQQWDEAIDITMDKLQQKLAKTNAVLDIYMMRHIFNQSGGYFKQPVCTPIRRFCVFLFYYMKLKPRFPLGDYQCQEYKREVKGIESIVDISLPKRPFKLGDDPRKTVNNGGSFPEDYFHIGQQEIHSADSEDGDT